MMEKHKHATPLRPLLCQSHGDPPGHGSHGHSRDGSVGRPGKLSQMTLELSAI
jgi:hypothetical protein